MDYKDLGGNMSFLKKPLIQNSGLICTRLVWGLWRGSMGSVTLLLHRNATGGARSDV